MAATLHFSINPDPDHLVSGHLLYFALFSAITLLIGWAIIHLVRRCQRREAALLGRARGSHRLSRFCRLRCR